jgi:hypothetical protein
MKHFKFNYIDDHDTMCQQKKAHQKVENKEVQLILSWIPNQLDAKVRLKFQQCTRTSDIADHCTS